MKNVLQWITPWIVTSRAALCLLAVLCFGTPFDAWVSAQWPPERTREQTGESLPQAGAGEGSVLNWSLAELRARIYQLKGLRSGENPVPLPQILQKVADNERAFLKNLPDVSSRERVYEEQPISSGVVRNRRFWNFNYLVVTHQTEGTRKLEEYRTDTHGRRIESVLDTGGVSFTYGFALTPLLFHTDHQPETIFRYLGEQEVNHKDTLVVAFAQKPGPSTFTTRVTAGDRSVDVLLQGVAWIDSQDFQIIRMRTDLLSPQPEIKLDRQTTVIEFTEVHLNQLPIPLWFPREVDVITRWSGVVIVNRHYYSGFKRFSAESVIKPAEATPQSPR